MNVLALSSQWQPENTSTVTSIEAPTMRELVFSYIKAPQTVFYYSTGVTIGTVGSMAFWFHEVINYPRLEKKQSAVIRDDWLRIGAFLSVSDCFPKGVLYEEIMTHDRRQMLALFGTEGNFINTMANFSRITEFFQTLDLLILVDLFPNETAFLAGYVLPATSFFEISGIPFIYLCWAESRWFLIKL